MVLASGYLKTLDDFRAIPLKTAAGGVPVTLGDVAIIQIGPEMRRGIAELDGDGEVAGGVVILRTGADARATIEAVRTKLDELKKSLPPGVAVVPTYDRAQLSDHAIENMTPKERTRVVQGKRGSVSVGIGGRRHIKKNTRQH